MRRVAWPAVLVPAGQGARRENLRAMVPRAAAAPIPDCQAAPAAAAADRCRPCLARAPRRKLACRRFNSTRYKGQMPPHRMMWQMQRPIRSFHRPARVPASMSIVNNSPPRSRRAIRTRQEIGEAWPTSGEIIGACPLRPARQRPSRGRSTSSAAATASRCCPTTATRGARDIRFGPRTADSVDKLVAAAWDYTKGWGIAGKQMYWRPILVLQLGPSGEARFAELQALLAHSGLEVERR